MREFFDAQYPAGSRDDEYFDMMLSRAITAYVDREGARMLARDSALPVPEDAAERKQKALEQVKAMQRHAAPEEGSKSKTKKRGVFFYVRKTVAVLFIALGLTVAIAVATVDAVRTSVFDMITSLVEDGVVQNEHRPDRPNLVSGDVSNSYLPEAIPSGFKSSTEPLDNNVYHIIYRRGDDYIDFWQQPKWHTKDNTDSMDGTTDDISINGWPGEISVGSSLTSICWSTDTIYFMITSTLPADEVREIAESVYVY